VTFLFDSRGRHIANLVNGQLHAPAGRNIGHRLTDGGIIIDMHGQYLGEVVHGARLLYKRHSPYRGINFGSYGDCGNAGNFGNPGVRGSLGMPGGYRDVVPDWL
jgi:hypothetical protein